MCLSFYYCDYAFYSVAAVNYVAISEALETSPSVLAAGLAADNVICAIYFASLFALASKIPAESSASTSGKSVMGTYVDGDQRQIQ